MPSEDVIQTTQMVQTLRATLVLRICAAVIVYATIPIRDNLPPSVAHWYAVTALPLIGFNVAAIIFSRYLVDLIGRQPAWLSIDLLFSVGILSIGGGWRSSYFEYTLTTVIIFTILLNRKGAIISSVVLALAALVKNPLPEGDPILIYNVSNLDMRIGAALFYPTAGLILGYFSTFVLRLNQVAEERVQKAKELSAVRQKINLAFDLHDRLKSKLTAILMVSSVLAQKAPTFDPQTAKEIQRQWQWLNYFQAELSGMVDSLKNDASDTGSQDHAVDLVALVREEVRILQIMTGFKWSINALETIVVPDANRETYSAFIVEAMTNAWKHSSAERGKINIYRSQNEIRMEVVDHGKGFHPQEFRKSATSGLQSMQRRCEELNGRFSIESSPGQGCKCTLAVAAPTTIPHG
jgi:signal transduction histidine kinase